MYSRNSPEKDRQMAFYSPLNGVGARDATASKTNAVWMKREGNQVNDENEITECTTPFSDQFCPEKPNVIRHLFLINFVLPEKVS